MKRLALALAAVLGAVVSLAGSGQAEQTFRTATDAVLVDVSVMTNHRPVTGLTPADFTLLDSGVAQQIDSVELVTSPIDLTLLVDTGNEVRDLELGSAVQHAASSTRSLLGTGDRGSLVTFDSEMRWGSSPGEAWSRSEQGTVLLDAVCAAVMERIDSGRRHIIVAITAGFDTRSLLPKTTRAQILARSESPVYFITAGLLPIEWTWIERASPGSTSTSTAASIRGGTPVVALQGTAVIMGDYLAPLRDIADTTGGRLFELRGGDSFLTPLRQALDEFRTRYVLRFRPRGVAAAGFHTLAVKMTRAGAFDVKARRGYWRD